MIITPDALRSDPNRVEEIEKASLRLVAQALHDFRQTANEIFNKESDLEADIGEDITREALDKMGVSKIDQRLFGKMDYKRARYVFHPDYAIRQALFIDSKAEKVSGQGTATLQTSQTSMRIRQIRSGRAVDVEGKIPTMLQAGGRELLTTTIFVKYNYRIGRGRDKNFLVDITLAALPNGMLQNRYNPDPNDTIWIAGRNAPSRGEAFRVRLSFNRLKAKQNWRVQKIPRPPGHFVWEG